MSKELIDNFDKALHRNNPVLASRLQPGLLDSQIRKILTKAGVKGDIDPIVRLFGWKNGTRIDPSLTQAQASPFPHSVYMFEDLEMMVAHFQGFREGAMYHPRMGSLVGRYFPIFWDGSTGWLAVNLESSKHGQVVLIETEWENPVREAYSSFEEFLEDAIRANEQGGKLVCLQ
jgi:hypothetical protein